MIFIPVLICIVVLILLISVCKINAFIAFLLVSVLGGLILHLPVNKIIASIQHGIGDTLGSLIIIISLGAMMGKIVAESGAAEKIASAMMERFGKRYIHWALMITGFIMGISLFYGVGFVLVVPLIFSVVYKYRLPAVATGLPMLAALSVTHGFLPPHPSPTALVAQFSAGMGDTLMFGLLLAIPAVIIAGPLFSRLLKNIPSQPMLTFLPEHKNAEALPGTINSFLSSLLPVLLLMFAAVLNYFFNNSNLLSFLGDPALVMLVAVIIAAFTLGIAQQKTMKQVMDMYAGAVKDVGMVLLIIAGAGALKQVLADSGISNQVATALQSWPLNPLLLGWLMAAIIRVCIGSATIAGLTAAGIIAPVVAQTHTNPALMVLSVGAGSLMFSHVNDPGFWMFKEYFNLSIKDTLKTWSVMETIISVTGLAGVMILQFAIHL